MAPNTANLVLQTKNTLKIDMMDSNKVTNYLATAYSHFFINNIVDNSSTHTNSINRCVIKTACKTVNIIVI